MKTVFLVALLALAPIAHADQENKKLLGAIAGGYLGSTIGGGDGKTAATVLGAIIGYRAGPQVLGNNQPYNQYNRNWYRDYQPKYRQADIYKLCERENPYYRDSRMYWSYNRGCVQRLSDKMRYMEQQAYEQGYQGQ